MSRFARLVIAAVVGFASQASLTLAQDGSVLKTAYHATGTIQGKVSDDRGKPLAGVMVSALGATAAFAITDTRGLCSLEPLPPGVYVVRAHLPGFITSLRDIVEVRPNGRASLAISLRRKDQTDLAAAPGPDAVGPQLMTAGVSTAQQDSIEPGGRSSEEQVVAEGHDHSGIAWRLRHLRRNVLKDTHVEHFPVGEAGDQGLDDGSSFFGRAFGSSARFASNLFTDFPFSGEFNWLATGAFDSARELFTASGRPHSVTVFSVRSPGAAAEEWSIDGALTQGDVSSWIVAGDYTNRPDSPHVYRVGMSYSAQRYQGGNKAALAAVGDGSRWAGSMFGYDSWTVRQGLVLDYGAHFARYGYLEGAGLFSPRISLTLRPGGLFNATLTAGRRLVAPGAEEFVPPGIQGLWLPPERTFAPIPRGQLSPERTDHYEVSIDRELAESFVVGFKAFYQRIDHQLATLFDVRVPDEPVTHLGHYYVASAGDVKARGWGVSISRQFTPRIRGSVQYARASADWSAGTQTPALPTLAPSAVRSAREGFHDITTLLDSEIGATATRVFALYKLNTAFANTDLAGKRPWQRGFGSRFDVQVNQPLPFLDFTNAQWEILVAVRTLFRHDEQLQSVYDELLVVRPPKRIVSGLTVKF